MTNSKCEESDGVRKVRLKTTSGVLTLCYRSSQSSREEDNSQTDASSFEKISQGGSQVSGISKESGFGSLPELFEFSDQFSLGEGLGGCSNLPPDFSTYNFWASEWGHSLPHVVGLSDTFPRCDLTGIIDHAAVGFQEPIVNDDHCPEDLDNYATEHDPHFQSTVSKSATIGEMNTNRKSSWDIPLELEEDIFECANYWNLVKEVTDSERDLHGKNFVVDDFLVDSTPSDFCDDVANAEILDSTVLVYAPNRYLESDAACIFQSPSADLEPDIETLGTVGGHRIDIFQRGCSSGRKGTDVREDCLKGGESMAIKSRNSDTTASCIEEPGAYDVQDVIRRHDPMSESKSGDKARVLRIHDFVNHRRRRFSALRGKRSKFPKRTTLPSVDHKRSPNQASRDIKPGRRVIRSPFRKSDPARRLFKAAASTSSDSQSAGESDGHSCDKSVLGTIIPRQLSVPSDHRKAHHVEHRAETSLGKSASTVSLLKDTLNQSSSRGAPTLKFSPLKDIRENRSFGREAPILKLNSNPCLLRKKRTRYADVLHSPDDSNKMRTRLHTELNLSQDSPKKIKCSNASTPRDSPAQFRRPKVSRKKVRTSRKGRSLQGSPTSAKKLHSYGKFVCERSSQVLKVKSPERDSQSETKSAEKKLRRRRLPLPPRSVEILQGWLHENLQDPYPSRQEKEDLLLQTGLKMSQIDNWLGNARQKLKLKSRAVKDLCSESSLSPEQPRKQSKRIARSYALKLKMKI